jgi:mercuric ion binding protein
MKAAVAGIGTAVAASACCIGPVVFTLLGADALSAALVSVLALPTPAQSPAAEQQQSTIRSATQAATQTCALEVSGMTCASCDVAVRLAAKSVSGVKTVNVDYSKTKAEVTYDPSKTNPRAIADAITKVSGFRPDRVYAIFQR